MRNAKVWIKKNMKTACDLWNEGCTFPLLLSLSLSVFFFIHNEPFIEQVYGNRRYNNMETFYLDNGQYLAKPWLKVEAS